MKIIIPFYVEKLSDGNPSIFHCLIWTGLPKILTKLKVYDPGIYFYLVTFTHYYIIYVLKAAVNAPKYAIKPEDIKTSPVKF